MKYDYGAIYSFIAFQSSVVVFFFKKFYSLWFRIVSDDCKHKLKI